MKILLLNQTFYPDAVATAQQLTDLSTYLVSQGHEVSVITGQRGYENRDKKFQPFEQFKGIKIFRVRSTGFGKQRFVLRIFDALTFDFMLALKLLFFPGQDIVISFTSPPLIGLFGVLFCLFKGGKAVQWLMDINPEAAFSIGYIKRKSPLGHLLNWAFDLTLKLSAHVVVLDRWMKKVAMEHGAQEENTSIIHPWSLFDPSPRLMDFSESVFRKANNFGNKTLIMYSGNHSVVHPLYTLLDAAKKLKDDPSIVFVFVGGGLRSLEVRAFKEKEQLENIVQLPTVPRELLSDALTSVNANVVVMGEAVNGLVHVSKVYGALATGRPIIFIGPEKSHVTDLLQRCSQAYHMEHQDVDAVISAIYQIKNLTAEDRERSARENKRFYQSQFSSQKCFAIFSEQVLKVPPTKEFIDSAELPEQYVQS
ncbi:MAG: glycosyltransferase family 4 protein [Deltaproteobacteria bacterium]